MEFLFFINVKYFYKYDEIFNCNNRNNDYNDIGNHGLGVEDFFVVLYSVRNFSMNSIAT